MELDTDLTKYMWKGSWGKYLMLLLLLKKKNYEAIEKVDPKENLYNNKIIRNVHAYARKQIDKR